MNIFLKSSLLLFVSVILLTSSGFTKAIPSALDSEGERIISEFKRKYLDYQSRGYKLSPELIPMQMASWLPYGHQVDQKSLMLSWQHDTRFFESIGHYVESHICRTKMGNQLCRIYFKKVNQKSSYSASLSEALAKHLILAISEQRKILDSWSSNYVMWLFVDPNEITVSSLNRWIIHEMYQIIDIKNSIGGSVAAAQELSGKNLCAITAGNVNIEARFASSAIRSYKIEDAIISELYNKNFDTLSHLKNRTCQFNIEWANTQLMEFHANLKDGYNLQMLTKIPDQCYGAILQNAMSSKDDIAFREKLFSDNPGTCEFLSEPDLDQIETLDLDLDFLDTWSHGPRPRVGGV